MTHAVTDDLRFLNTSLTAADQARQLLALVNVDRAANPTETWLYAPFDTRVQDILVWSAGTVASGRSGVSGEKPTANINPVERNALIPLTAKDVALLELADAGNAEAQNDLAQVFLARSDPRSAVYWLQQAACRGNADAMNWLGRCLLDGIGVARDEALGLTWISRAAALGHRVSQHMVRVIRCTPGH